MSRRYQPSIESIEYPFPFAIAVRKHFANDDEILKLLSGGSSRLGESLRMACINALPSSQEIMTLESLTERGLPIQEPATRYLDGVNQYYMRVAIYSAWLQIVQSIRSKQLRNRFLR